uniref:Uncharacterized protein n=1 Tax=uncultured Thiotrichaceae bacterium TaxID=298394 RepID=A0A6S6TIC2_9GAMM|nr:MAG: Unknown protein [uncultured Thiotrichaceae bacterium]
MKTDAEIRSDGLRLLFQHLGDVDAGRFLAMVNRERFDYTEWRKTMWSDETVASLAVKARKLRDQVG